MHAQYFLSLNLDGNLRTMLWNYHYVLCHYRMLNVAVKYLICKHGHASTHTNAYAYSSTSLQNVNKTYKKMLYVTYGTSNDPVL